MFKVGSIEYVSLKLLSIDAWRDSEGGWYWNDMHCLDDSCLWGVKELTPRKVLNALRRAGFLSDWSKGRVRVDMHDEMMDGYLIEILNKNTGEPLFALSDIH